MTIEWKSGDDGWNRTPDETASSVVEVPESPPAENPTRHPGRRRRITIALGLIVSLITVTGALLKWTANRNVAAAEVEVQGVIDQEMWALESGNWDLYESLLDQRRPLPWYRKRQEHFVRYSERGTFSAEIVDFALVEPDLALVEVRIDPPGRQPYRETRAYRRTDVTWQHTVTSRHSWLHPVVRETANLRFVFHRQDADRLDPLLPAVQDLYTQILSDFNLSPLPNKRELQIVLGVEPADSAFTNTGRRYDLSPLALTRDTQRIQRELGRQLARRVMGQFYDGAGEMAFILDAIRKWEVSTWMGETDTEFEARISQALDEEPFIPLLMVKPVHFDNPTTLALAETFVDYLVWRNGRSIVNRLIQAARMYETWPDLITHGLELPYQDVSRGWWYFVARHYAAPMDHSHNEVRSALTKMLTLERQALATRNQDLFRSLLDPRAPSEWQSNQLNQFLKADIQDRGDREIRDWGYDDNVAWATLERRSASATGTNRFFSKDVGVFPQLRVYRLADHRWYVTSPDIAFSDPPLTARTKHFEFRYREPDDDLIQSVLPRIDELYEHVVQDIGNATHPSSQPLTVELVYSLEDYQYRRPRLNEIQIPSPWVVSFAFGSTREQFEIMLGGSVVDHLVEEAIDRQSSNPSIEVERLLNWIAMWEVQRWGKVPTWEAEGTKAIQQELQRGVSPSLSPTTSPLDSTIVEYIADTFGRHRFADLIEAANEHRRLRDLIPAVLNVDLGIFMANWQLYLEQTYASNTDS